MLTTIAVLAISCSNESDKQQSDVNNVPLKDLQVNSIPEDASAQKSWIPEGSTTAIVNNELEVTPPSGWSYVGYDKASNSLVNVLQSGKTKVSCTCNKSGSCSPFVAEVFGGSTAGCAGGCTDCTMKQSLFSQGSYVSMSSGGYYSLSSQTRLIQSGEKLPAVFDALTELPEFKTRLEDFYKTAYGTSTIMHPVIAADGSATAPAGHSLVGISILGRAFIGVVPNSYANSELGFSTDAKASCPCTKGSCKLKRKNVVLGSATWCEGSCTGTCTLDTSSKTTTKNYSLTLMSPDF